jgi:hypothetical protein
VVGVSVASEFEHAVQVLDDVALLHRMAEGTLMPGCPRAAWELLEHRRRELLSVSVAVAAQLLGVSRTTVVRPPRRRGRLDAAASASRGHHGR